MATTTTNLGLIEPAGQDRALVANINTNSEKIDAEAGKARANFALVQNGDTATQAISQGQLVVWKGALKKATANIASGATLSSSNLTDDSIASEIASLNGKLNVQNVSFTMNSKISSNGFTCKRIGNIVLATGWFINGNTPVAATETLVTNLPRNISEVVTLGNSKKEVYYIAPNGTAIITVAGLDANASDEFTIIYFTNE